MQEGFPNSTNMGVGIPYVLGAEIRDVKWWNSQTRRDHIQPRNVQAKQRLRMEEDDRTREELQTQKGKCWSTGPLATTTQRTH
jgi:hypothetical protein